MIMLENKVSELEKRIKELEEENKSIRKKLDELIYHYMLEMGTGAHGEHDHSMIPRNVKKTMLKNLRSENGVKEIIFGEDYYEKLELRKIGMWEIDEKLESIIDEMTDEECEKKLNEIFAAKFKETMEFAGDDPEKVKKKLGRIIEYRTLFRGVVDIITRGSESLWSIFDKIREEKELEQEKFIKELVRPYLEKYDEISYKIEEQKKKKP